MGHAGIRSNVVVLTTLMNLCQRAGQHEHAIRLFRTMEADGLAIDVVRPFTTIFASVPISPGSNVTGQACQLRFAQDATQCLLPSRMQCGA